MTKVISRHLKLVHAADPGRQTGGDATPPPPDFVKKTLIAHI